MKQRLLRILSVLCILALACGCLTLPAFAEEDIRVVTVQWNDDNDYEGLRPKDVTVTLGDESVTLNEDNNWYSEIKGAPGAQWSEPSYDKYAKTVSGTDVRVIQYSHVPEKLLPLNVSVVWDDNDDEYGIRPETVRVKLLADGVVAKSTETNQTKQWKVSWNNIYKNKKTDDGPAAITYSIEETEVPGYVASVSDKVVTYTLLKGTLKLKVFLNPPDGADIKGLHLKVSGPNGFSRDLFYKDVASGSVDFGKVRPGAYLVEDQNASSLIPDYVIDPAGSQVTDGVYVNAGDSKELTFKYTWKKGEVYKPEEGYNPEDNYKDLKIHVLGPYEYEREFTYDQFDENGKLDLGQLVAGTYVVYETNSEGLVRKYNLQSDSTTGVVTLVANNQEPAKLYNKYKPDYDIIDIPVTKIWNDNGNRDGNRPSSITVNLLANGTFDDSHNLTAEEGWQYTFTGKPTHDADGKEIKYTISENPVAWYDGSVNGYFVTNDYNPETTTASVYKIWDDNDNERNLRPNNIAVTLLPTGKIYMLTAANDWSLTVDNLPTKLNGEDVTYSWKEEETVGYVLAGTEVSGNSVVFYNHASNVPKIPEWMPQAKVPGDMWFIFEEYETALGGEILINHVGDCFD